MIKPCLDYVLLEKEMEQEKTESGIILTEHRQDKSYVAKVIAVSEGRLCEGVILPTALSVNDRVIFEKYGGTEIKYEGKEYCLIQESKILAIIK